MTLNKIKTRFESKFVKSDVGCWEWTDSLSNGYGRLKINGSYQRAPRVSYMIYKGRIPDGMIVLHSCNNKKCVNPNHLRLGTKTENGRDAAIDGANGAKLDVQDIDYIRRMLDSGLSLQEVADMYNVSRTTIREVKNRRTWIWVE